MWNLPKLQKFVKTLPRPNKIFVRTKRLKFCVVGGTFDRMHIGHKTLINTALIFSENILICVTSDTYVRKLRKIAGSIIEPYKIREEHIRNFVAELDQSNKVHICILEDPYSPALTSQFADKLDSIAVSEDPAVLARTFKLNELRKKHDLGILTILRIPLLRDPYGKVISSTRYRLNDYFPPPRPPKLRVTKDIIDDIRKPKGTAVSSPKDLPDPDSFKKKGIVVIGDAAFNNLSKFDYPISVAIIDFKIQRRDLNYTIFYNIDERRNIIDAPPIIPVLNSPGTISTQTWFVVLLAYVQTKPSIISVYGEEDLLGFPATVLAPEGALIIYGDPFRNKLVYFIADWEQKEKAFELLSKMQKI